MMQWITLFKKEMVENWRNFKWIWVPLVLTLLAIMDPITTYYMPVILDAVGGLPEGAVFKMPDPSPIDAIMMSLSQLSSLGVFIIILMAMGTIAGEIKSGVSELVLVKPVHFFNYISAKWLTILLVVWLSLFISLTMSWYYVRLLFGDLSFTSLLQIIFFYGLWYTFVITLTIFFSALVNRPGVAGALTIGTTILISVVTSLLGKHLQWSPSNLSQHIQEILIKQEMTSDLTITALLTILCTIVLLIGSYFVFSRREFIQ